MIFPVRGLFLAAVLFPAIVFAGNVNRITYQGRILKPDGSPLKAVTNFRFTIRSSNECVLWTEVLTVDLSMSSGAFTAIVGDGVNTASGGHQFREIFDNTTTLTGLSGCISGSTYGAGLADDRVLEVSFNDGSGSQNLPAIAIKSVPFANFAQKSASTSTLLDKKLSSVSQPTVDGQILKYDLGTDSWIAGPAGSLGVTFVGIGLPPSIFSNGAGVSSSGTLSATLVSQSPNTVFAAPTGTGGGTPLFRNLVASDIPGLPASQLTAGTLGAERGGTGVDGSMAADGQILIGNGTGFSLGTLSAGSNISISNSPGGIQISATHTLATTGVVAGSYGSSTYIPNFTVDSYGRLTSAGSVAVSIPASMTSLNGLTAPDQVFAIGSSGTVAAFTSAGSIHTLNIPAASGVGVAGGLLSNDDYLIIMNGTIPAARIAGLSAAHITSGTFASARLGVIDAANGGTGLDGSSAGIGQLLMGNGSGYTLGSLAAGSNISITNTNGTITIASSNSGGTVTYIDTGAGLVGGGFSTVGTISLGTTGVAAGAYGSATYIPTITVDQYGRLTSAGSVGVTSSQWADIALGINYASGSVGIGVASPVVKLDIDGAIKIANDSATCTAGFAGAIRYNAGLVQYCDGVTAGWVTLGVSGAGLQSINGLNANNQSLVINTSGTLVAIVSSGSTHTVSVPMASTTNAAGGLISNSDYLTLMNGTIPVSRVAGAGTLNSAVMSVTAGTGLDGGTITSNGTISLGTTGVAAGSYGSSTYIPTLNVDAFGRITSAGSIAVSIPAALTSLNGLTAADQLFALGSGGTVAAFTSAGSVHTLNIPFASSANVVGGLVSNADYLLLMNGTIPSSRVSLGTSGVVAGAYGGASWVPNYVVDAFGRLTSAGSTAIALDASALTSGTLALARLGVVSAANGGTGLDGSAAGIGQLLMGNGSGYTLGSLAAGSNISITNTNGTITIASSNSGGTVTQVDTGAGLVGGGFSTVGTISLGTTGVAAGAYGSATYIPTMVVDQYGRITSAGSVSVNSSQWTDVALGINYGSGGSVGIGVASPIVKLDIDGAIKIANDSATCAAGFAGAIRYNTGVLQYCDGVTAGWVTLGVSGSGLQNLNGLNANAQLFAINTSGTLVAITSAGSTHTVSVPMASTTNAAGGLISNSDYLTLMNGTIPVSRVAGAGTLNSAVMSVTAGSGLDGGTITSNGTISLGTSGVAAGSYGGASFVPNFTVDSYGRVTSVGSTAIAIDASAITSGTLATARFGTTGVSAGSYGSSNYVPTFSVDAQGRLTNAGSVAVASSGGTVQEVVAGAGLLGGTISTFGTISLPTTGVTAGSTGTASFIPTFIVDAYGRLTGRGSVAVAIDASAITSGTLSLATVGTIPVSRVAGAGTLNSAVMSVTAGSGLDGGTITSSGTISLGTTGVAAGVYGSSTHIPTLTVDAFGRLTSAGSVAVNSSQWTNIALGINYGSGGSVGIGVASPVVKLDIDGAIKIANDSATCAAGFAGAIRYNGGLLQYCDGVTVGWVTLGVSGSGLQNLNGLNSNAQLFAINTSGTVVAITSAGSTHTFSVPMASTTNAAGGLISNSDYLTLMNGTIPVSRVAGAGTLNSAVMSVTAGTGLDGGTITSNGTISLGTTGVTAATYGNAAYISNIGVDQYGRVASMGSTAIAIDASAITSGTLATARFGTTGVSAGSYGSSNYVPTFSVDAQGRLTNAGSVAVASSGGTVQEVVAGAGLLGGTISTFGTISLPTTGVTAGSTGTASFIPTFIVDAYGRLTGRGSVAVAIDASAITSGTLSLATVGTIPVSQVLGAGTLNSAVMSVTAGSGLDGGTITSSGTISLATTGVTAGTVGSSGWIPQIGFDIYGRIVSMGSTALSLSGLSGTLDVSQGGTGLNASSAANGQLLIGNGSGFTLGTLNNSNGILITNGSGVINIATNAQTTNATLSIVSRDMNGSFAANKGTFNSIDLNNAGALVTIQNPAAANYTLTLPANMGSAGQVLQTNGTSATTWVSAPVNGGVMLAASGNMGTPGISFLADSNTGLYNPGDGTIGFSSNGTMVMRMDPSLRTYFFGDTSTEAANLYTTNLISTGGRLAQQNANALNYFAGSLAVGTSSNPTAPLDVNGLTRTQSLAVVGSGTMTLLAPLSGNNSLRLPATMGTLNQALVMSGVGTLGWATVGDGSVTYPLLSTTRGSVATPAYSFSADTDTGLYSPGANTLAISTGGTARITIDHLGRVGIRTTSPGYGLEVQDTVSIGTNFFNESAWNGEAASNFNGSSDSGKFYRLMTRAGFGYGGYEGPNIDSPIIWMWTSPDDRNMFDVRRVTDVNFPHSSGTSLFTVRESGRVGIGTTTPQALLDVNGSSRSTSVAIAGAGTATLLPPTAGNNSWRLPATAGTMGQALVLSSAGTLGWTDLGGGSPTFPLLSTTRGSVGTPAYSFNADSDTGLYSPGANTLAISTGGTARVTLDGQGYVGIGTDSPNSILDVVSSGAPVLTVRSTASNANSALYLIGRNGGVDNTGIIYAGQGGEITMRPASGAYITLQDGASNNRLNISNAGHVTLNGLSARATGSVGIGTTSPSQKLDVNGGLALSGAGTAALLPPTAGINSWTLPATAGTMGQALVLSSAGTLGWSDLGGGITFPLLSTTRGSVGTPAYSFSADTDTGLFSPGANTLAISTGGTARFTVASDGKIGIGTDSPAQLLEVAGTSRAWVWEAGPGSSTNPSFSFSAGNYGVFFPGGTATAFTTNGTERMRILSTGQVGIGTQAPDSNAVLTLTALTEPKMTVRATGTNANAYIGLVARGSSTDNEAVIYADSGGNLVMRPSSASENFIVRNGADSLTRFFVSGSTGSVGVGTSTPQALLDVNGSSRSTSVAIAGAGTATLLPPTGGINSWRLPATAGTMGQALVLSSAGTLGWSDLGGGITFPLLSTTRGSVGTPAYSFSADSDTGLYSPGANTLAISTGGTARITVDNSGYVGIGTAAPQYPLHVRGGSASQVMVEATGTFAEFGHVNGGNIVAHFSSDNNDTWVENYRGALILTANSSERMRITSGGNVGVGTANPQALFDVNGTARSTSVAIAGAGTATLLPPTGGINSWRLPATAGTMGQALVLSSAGTLGWTTLSGGGVTYPLLSTTRGSVGTPAYSFNADSDTGLYSPGANTLAISTGGAARITVDNSGYVGIGTTTPGFPLEVHQSSLNSVIALQNDNVSSYSDVQINDYNGVQRAGYGYANPSAGEPTLADKAYFASMGKDFIIWNDSAKTVATFKLSGSVGVGTTSPQALLDVNGSSRSTSVAIAGAGTATLLPPTGGTNSWRLPATAGTMGQALVLSGAGTLGWSDLGGGITFPLLSTTRGSVGTPAYSFNADTDTGLYSPGANTLAISTAGTARITINHLGQVGIGVQNPVVALQVSGSMIGSTLTVDQGAAVAPTINDATGNGFFFPSGAGIGFSTTNTERMRINSAGSIGVGTASPQALFDVNGTARSTSVAIAGAGTATLLPPTGGINSWRLPATAGTMGQALVLSSAGTLGWSDLGGGITFPLLSTTRGSVGTPAYSFSADTDTGLYSPGANTLAISTAGTARLAIDHLGNVGIGSSSPTSILDIVANGAPTLTIRSAAANANSGIDLVGRSSSTNYTASIWAGQAGELNAKPASGAYMALQDGSGNERLGIGSDGNVYSNGLTARASGSVGVGTTTPQALFEVAGVSRSQSHAYVGSGTMTLLAPLSGNNSLRLPATMGTLNQALVMSGVGTLGWATVGGSSITYPLLSTTRGSVGTPAYSFNGDSDTGIYSPAANAIAITAGGVDKFFVNAGGSIGIGTTTPSGAVEVSGGSTASGAGGATYIRGQAAGPGGNDGGSVYIQGGDRTGSNENGKVILNSVTEVWKSLKIMNGSGEGSYSGSGTLGSTPFLLMEVGNNSNSNASIMGLRNRNSSGTDQYGFLGVVPTNASYTPSIVFGQQTGANSWSERMRVTSEGALAIGTTATASNTLLEVAGGVTASSTYEGVATAYVTSGTGYSIPDTNLNIRRITLSNNTTLRLPAYTAGAGVKMYQVTIFLKQDATGGRTITWLGNGSDTIKWDTNVAPTIVSAPNKITIIQLMKPSDETVWYGSLVWQEQ